MMLEKWYARKNQSLLSHLTGVYSNFRKVLEAYEGIAADDLFFLHIASVYAALLHDIGKATDVFKSRLEGEEISYYHSLLSVAVLYTLMYPLITYAKTTDALLTFMGGPDKDTTPLVKREDISFIEVRIKEPLLEVHEYILNQHNGSKEKGEEFRRKVFLYLEAVAYAGYVIYRHHSPLGNLLPSATSIESEKDEKNSIGSLLTYFEKGNLLVGKSGKVGDISFDEMTSLVQTSMRLINKYMEILASEFEDYPIIIFKDKYEELKDYIKRARKDSNPINPKSGGTFMARAPKFKNEK